MRQHKFILGQAVASPGTTMSSLYGGAAVLMPAGMYEIVKQMPNRDGQPQYRVRSAQDGHERVVVEDELCPSVRDPA